MLELLDGANKHWEKKKRKQKKKYADTTNTTDYCTHVSAAASGCDMHHVHTYT